MATLTLQAPFSLTGGIPTLVPAGAGGDSVPPGDHNYLWVENGSASPITVTIVIPGSSWGVANADTGGSVPANGRRIFGPFPVSANNAPSLLNPSTGLVDVTYSSVTSVTVGAVGA